MNSRPWRALAFALAGWAALAGQPTAVAPRATAVDVPFDLAAQHIIVQATIDRSRPLSFVFDTGSAVDVVRLDTATALGLTLGGVVNVGGAGAGRQAGRLVTDATWSLVGLESVALPVRMALPLPEMPAALGRDIDGIVGGRLIRQFVVEVDYQRRRLTFHDPALFRYDGPGQVLPLDFNASGHRAVTAVFTPLGGPPVERPFIQVARPRRYASRPVHRASRT